MLSLKLLEPAVFKYNDSSFVAKHVTCCWCLASHFDQVIEVVVACCAVMYLVLDREGESVDRRIEVSLPMRMLNSLHTMRLYIPRHAFAS